MPTSLTLPDHVAAIRTAADRMITAYASTGPDAEVPTCPSWTMADLMVHQSVIHRWAAGNLRGEGEEPPVSEEQVMAEADDLGAYLADGVTELLATIDHVPDDVEAMVFVLDAPPPRRFWARRQAHETTIHSIDALAAALRRTPAAAEADIPVDLAVDGIDELVCGFAPRRSPSRLYAGEDFAFVVRATDADAAWTLQVDESLAVTSDHTAPTDVPQLTGTAAELYLGLWNRGTQITGDPRLLQQWANAIQVEWT